MKNYINGISNSYNKVYVSNKKPQNIHFAGVESAEKENRQDNLSAVTNDSVVKVPMSYVKTGEKELPYGLKAHFYKLSNGQKIVILPKEGKTVLRSYVNTGSLNEPDNIRGISHYIEHNLFNGSNGLEAGEFFKTTDNIGADTNASTGLAETNYYIASNLLNDTDLENEIKIHASMLETPRFALDMLEKEKGIVNSEINMITSNPDNIAYNTTLKNLFNIKTSSNDIIAGSTDNITNLTREDVVDYFNKNYFPANMVTVVSGEVEPDSVMKLISKYFNSNKQTQNQRYFESLNPISKPVRQDLISDKTKSTHLVMGFVGPKNNDTKNRIYINALSNIMFDSSEAQKVFNNLNTSIESSEEKILAKPDANRAIMLLASVSDKNSEDLLKNIYCRIEKYQNELISEQDLKILKRDLKKEFRNIFESSFAINDFIGTSILENSVDAINNYEKIIDEMTSLDLQNTAKEYFDLNKTAVTVLHSAGTDKSKILENYNKSNNVSFTGKLQKQALNTQNIKQYNLQNNYRVLTYNSNIPNMYATMMLRVEEPIIPKNKATIVVLNEMLKNGTMNHTKEEFLRKQEVDGTDVGIRASVYGLFGKFSSDVEDYDKAFDTYKEILNNPRFTQENFEKSVSDVKDRYLRAEKKAFNKLKPVLYKTQYTKEDILNSIDSLKLEDVVSEYNQLLKNAHSITSVAAPFENHNNLKNKVLKDLSELNSVKPYVNINPDDYKKIEKTQVLTDIHNKSQANIIMAYTYKNVENIKDAAAINIMNHILGGSPSSRLFNDLREKQKLAYSVHSDIENERTTGSIRISIGTTTDNKETGEKSYDNVQKSINGFKKHIELLKNEKITPEELEKAKLALKNEILSGNESTIGKNLSILQGGGSFYGAAFDNMYLDELDKITVEDIYNTARNVFSGKPVYSVLATEDTLKYNKEYLDKLAEI